MRADDRQGKTGAGGSGVATKPRRTALVALALAALLPQGAGADLVGNFEGRAAVAELSDAALIEANPLLRGLQDVDPGLLDEALQRLRSPAGAARRGLEDADVPPPEADDGVLADNPDIDAFYRESPEAALDLIRLIREAANKK